MHILNESPFYREENAASENAKPPHHFWKCDKKSIQQIDDGNPTKSFSFGMYFTSTELRNVFALNGSEESQHQVESS